MRLLLAGDVMLGRGVDQILPHPGSPVLRERYVQDARRYVDLAADLNGTIPQPVNWSWPWGDALPVFRDAKWDVRIINVETSITSSDDFYPGKGVHYRMSPANVAVLTEARPDVCVLANNHVMDFGRRGLEQTLDVLAEAGVRVVGAGRTLTQAQEPAVVPVPRVAGRVIVLAVGATSGGVPVSWAATPELSGVHLLPRLTPAAADRLAELAAEHRQSGDVVVLSIHWGSNWGRRIEAEQREFAHRLIDGGVDVVFGHSSHHPRPIEVYRGKLILYGCGDLINDYEGIAGHEEFHADLRLLYQVSLDPTSGELTELQMTPLQARRLRLHRADATQAEWLARGLEADTSLAGEQIFLTPVQPHGRFRGR